MKRRSALGFISLGMVFILGCGNIKHDPKTITVWHWMADRHDDLVHLARKYEQETGIAVDFQLTPADVYSQKVIAAAQARILPDIFGVLDEKSILAEFIKSGFVADLTAYFDAEDRVWRKRFFDEAVAGSAFEAGNAFGVDPGVYGVPLDITTIQMVYNRRILEKAGVDNLPETFEEFIEAAQKIRSLGIEPFVSGWSEQWLVDCFALNYAFNIMGKEKVMATFRGEVPYTDPDWISVFAIFQTMAQQGVISSSIVTKSNKFAEQDFALERAAFAFNGSWGVNVYKGMNPDLEYGVMMPPSVSDQHPLLIWGGAGSSLMVNAASLNKERAVAFLKWLTEEGQQVFLSEQTQNLPANRNAQASFPEALEAFGRGMAFATHPSIWPEEEDVLVREIFTKGIQSIVIGEKSPQQAAEEIQSVKERQMKRLRRRR